MPLWLSSGPMRIWAVLSKNPSYKSVLFVSFLACITISCSGFSWGKFWETSGNSAGNTTSSVTRRLITDTGQTLCASGATATGAMSGCPNASVGSIQDGDFVNIPTARLFSGPTQHSTFTNDYTTTDNASGLIWKTCIEGLSGGTCATGTATTVAWGVASTSCSALNSQNSGSGYAGKTNWRQPTLRELQSLVNYSASSQTIDTANFPASGTADAWSASVYAPTPTSSWFVSFSDGNSNATVASTNNTVRCVSGNLDNSIGQYVDNGDGTVTDMSNDLRWQKCSRGLNNDGTCSGSATTSTWQAALTYCQTLPLAGRTWRLPNQNELNSLVNIAASNPAINSIAFPGTVADFYWTSTTYVPNPTAAWVTTFIDGVTAGTAKSAAGWVRCVSTGP